MTAELLPNGEQQFFDANGIPLALGSVSFFLPATTTRKNTWQDAGQSIKNTNPVILDAAGRAKIYGVGAYRQVLRDVLGNTVWDTGTAVGNANADYVATIAVLRTFYGSGLVLSDGATVFVQGYYTRGDGRSGGMYFYDATDTTSPDNGGTVIVDADGRRFKLITSSKIGNVLWFGAYGDGIHDDTAAIVATRTVFNIAYAPTGRYLLSDEIVIELYYTGIIGDGVLNTVFVLSDNGKGGFVIGKNNPAQYIVLRDFGIEGAASSPYAIKFGTSGTTYCANLCAERVRAQFFSATAAFVFQAIQQSHFIDCILINNYIHVFRPDTTLADGYLTTTEFSGASTRLSRSTAYAIWAEGEMGTLTVRNAVMEENAKDCILLGAPTHTVTGTKVILDGCYFESNNSGGAADGEITVQGNAAAYGQTRLIMRNCEFHTQAVACAQISADHAVLDVQDTEGLDLSKVGTTANTISFWKNNALITNNAASSFNLYMALNGTVTVEDQDYLQYPYRIAHGTLIGSRVEGANDTPQALTSAVALQVTSLPLSPGEWDISAQGTFSGDAGTAVSRLLISVGNSVGVDPSNGKYAAVLPAGDTPFTAGDQYSVSIAPVRANPNVVTTYYLTARAEFTGGACSVMGTISARCFR